MHMITLRNIHKSFGKLEVLKGIDLDIAPREVVSIVGPSGAGKTTLLQIMGTLYKPDEGTVNIAGCDVLALSSKNSRVSVPNTWASCSSFTSCCPSSAHSKM